MSEYQYNKVTPEMIEKFKEIAPKRVLVGDEINEDFTHDEMAIYGKARPEVLVEATSTEEVAAVVKLCNENKVPVTPSGARTGLVGGAVSIGGGVMISLTKMNKILGYDKENFVVKIQSGVLLNDLAQDAEKQGLLLQIKPLCFGVLNGIPYEAQRCGSRLDLRARNNGACYDLVLLISVFRRRGFAYQPLPEGDMRHSDGRGTRAARREQHFYHQGLSQQELR